MAANQTSGKYCACGSGLIRARCCDLNLAVLSASGPSRQLDALEVRAAESARAGDAETAARYAIEVLESVPARPGALAILYDVRKNQANEPAAHALISRLAALEPGNLWATKQLAQLQIGRFDIAAAEQTARAAIRLAPDDAEAHQLLAMTLVAAHRPAAAEYHFRRALALSGARDPYVLANLAACLKDRGKQAAARELYDEALAAAPQSLNTLLGFARLEESRGNFAAAMSLLDRAELVFPDDPAIILLRAVLLFRLRNEPAALALVDLLTAGDEELDPAELLETGRLLDRIGRYDAAFAAFTEGKRRLRDLSGQAYRAREAADHVFRLKYFFVADRLRHLPRAATLDDAAQPIFILGFPRSGAALLDQTLAAHARIEAGIEGTAIADIAAFLPALLASPLRYPEALAELHMADHRDDLAAMRDHYLQRATPPGLDRARQRWFIDRVPLNETDLGLMTLLFPESPMLYVVRHPLDVVLSCVSNLVTAGFNCAHALETAARHYVLIADLVTHYRAELTMPFLQVRYEDLVDDQEATVRRVLSFIGEKFDPSCLAFTEKRRHASARYRYRSYIAHLKPVIPILDATIARLGYRV